MDLRKKEKYQYKFLKSVWAGEYDKLRGYFLKYVEYSNNPVLADGFSKIDSMVQTGGSISVEEREKYLSKLYVELLRLIDFEIVEKLMKALEQTDLVKEEYKNGEMNLDIFIAQLINKLRLEETIKSLTSEEKDEFKKINLVMLENNTKEAAKIAEDTAHSKSLPPYTSASRAVKPGEKLANKIFWRVMQIINAEGESSEKNSFMDEFEIDERFDSVKNDPESINEFINDIYNLAQKHNLGTKILNSIFKLKEEFKPGYKISGEHFASPALEPGTGPYTGFDTRSELSYEEGDKVHRSSTARAFAHGARPELLEKPKPVSEPVPKLVSEPVPKPVPESESESVVSMGGNDIPYNSFPLMTLEYFKLNKQYLPNKLK